MATPVDLYTGALGRYAASKKQAMAKMTQAETGYGDLAAIYAPGGSYGAGQTATIEKERARGVSIAQAGMTGTGMSSSTNALGMGAQFTREATQAKLGVEDTRADKYASVLQGLASLRMAAAGQIGGMAANEPSYAPAASQYGTDVNAATQRYSAGLGYEGQMRASQMATQNQMAIAQLNNATEVQLEQMKLGANVSVTAGQTAW